jgi:hypothetical protein
MELNKSSVIFNQENHTYTLGSKMLSGVTTMMSAMLFPGKYDNVPEYIVERARDKGSYIHECCELVDSLGVEPDSEEAIAYRDLMARLNEQLGIKVEESEYLISDNRVVASSIDKVLSEGDDIYLADIKTTYKLDMDWLRWQLSIYAYLFELQNPGKYVSKLFAIWLRGSMAKFVEVERIGITAVIDLIRHFDDGEAYESPVKSLARIANELPSEYAEMESTIREISEQADFWAAKKKELTEGIMKEMVAAGEYTWKGETIQFIRRRDTIRKSFDAKQFQADYPELYEKYVTDSPVVGSVSLKINKKKEEE